MGGNERYGLLEMGSNSLKLYLVSMPDGAMPSIQTLKFPWRIAHAFFERGSLDAEAAEEIITRLCEARERAHGLPFESVMTIATGMFREIDNLEEVTERVAAEAGVRMRVISGADEAGLMARGFRDQEISAPALLCDLGGATLEWAWQGPTGESECGSERLGAIRNQYAFAEWQADPEDCLERSASHCDRVLAGIPAAAGAQVVATGGTAKAIAMVAGTDVVPLAELEALARRAVTRGPPAGLKPHRAPVFAAGAIVLWRVVAHCGAPDLRYGTSAVRHGMVVRLLQLLERHPPEQLHATQLLRTTQEGTLELGGATDTALAPGSRVGRYVIVEKLGAGGMGVVYRATDPTLGREIALKVMAVRPTAGSTAAEVSGRLLREAQSLAKLSHPHVVSVHDVGTVGDDVFVAMELVEGKTLSEWRRDEKPTQAQILEVFAAAGRGVEAAHRANLVHRDFKPENVIVAEDGRVRVLDFGLARIADPGVDDSAPASAAKPVEPGQDRAQQSTGRIIGTPAYMAPEQHRGGSVDERSDQFSFCVTLYEALYDGPPFAGKTLEQLKRAVDAGRVEEPPEGTGVSPKLRRVLLRGLAVDRDHRYPSMTALLAGLDSATSTRGGGWRTLAMLAAAALAAFAIAIALGASPRSAPTRPCADAGTVPADVWDAEVKVGVRNAFLATGRPHAQATFDRVAKVIDGHAAAWVAMRTEACEATRVHATQSDEVLALRNLCLDRRLEEIRELAARFRTADARGVDNSIHDAFTLGLIAQCADVDALLAEARAEEKSGDATARTKPAPGCGLVAGAPFSPLAVGRKWVYDVVDPSTGLPRSEDPKVVSVEALEKIGGCKGYIEAFRVRSQTAPGYALRWQETRPVSSPPGFPAGELTLRHRDLWTTNDGIVTKEEYYQPERIRLDGTCAHTLPRASYLDTYDEVEVEPGRECGKETKRKTRTFDWQVVETGAVISLDMDYSHPACCSEGSAPCSPPPDGPGHTCVRKEGSEAASWRCRFETLMVRRREVDGGKLATYWFAPGVGKVKELSRGEEIEHLICFAVP